MLGQDERSFYQLFDKRNVDADGKFDYKWSVASKVYKLDLDQDGEKEGMVVEFKDSETWLSIYAGQRQVFTYKLLPTGLDSKLYRVRLKTIAPKVVALILYFYEGYTTYLNMQSVTRVYFGAIVDGDLRKIDMIRGPHIFEEREDWLENYEQKVYSTDFFDFNGDGVMDISIKNKLISRVYSYNKSKRRWSAY
jgi:hypothetical protein